MQRAPDHIDDMLRQMAIENIKKAPHFISINAGHRGLSNVVSNLENSADIRQMLLDALSFIDQMPAQQ